MARNSTRWGIHAGKTGDADRLFLKSNAIALGWQPVVGEPVVSQLPGKVEPERQEHGIVVTLGTYTNQAIQFARAKGNLRLIAGDELATLILQHHEQFDSKCKPLPLLERVCVPEPLEEAE